MKHLQKLLSLLLIIFLVSFTTGCKEKATEPDPEVPINETEVLVKYLETSGTTYGYIYDCTPFVYDAANLRTDILTDPTKIRIIDIRTATDFNTRRLTGAVNVALKDLRSYFSGLNLDNFNRVVLVCYSGQSAAYATSLMRSLYPVATANKIVSLKFGMSAIDSVFAQNYWLARRSNARAGQFVTTDSIPKPAPGKLPVIKTGKKTGREILEARIDTLLNQGFTVATISEATVFQNLANYFILNYWPYQYYRDPGHIPGAYHYDPAARPFLTTTHLRTLPTDKPIVFYCYTGQTSAYFAGYLRLLGYDLRSLLYGANSMIYDLMRQKGVPNAFNPANDIKGYKDLLVP